MSDTTIRIRDAKADDLEAIVSFNEAMALETEDKTLDHEAAITGVRNGLASPDRSRYFIAEVDGRIVGQTMFTTEWSDWRNGFFWWIQSVYVDPEYRRKGVFRALHEHIRALAHESPDVCGLRLYVHHANTRAIETYRNLGMSVTDYRLCEEEW